MDYQKIGKFIQEQRKKLGMTQQELADKLKVTNKAISRWETGQGCPDVSLLGELSDLLHVGIGELLNGENNEQLKNNDKFILEAVNYSKQTTTHNIYKKLCNIIYIILGCICFLFLIQIIQQERYFMIKETIGDTNKDFVRVKDLAEEIKSKTIIFSKLDNNIYKKEDLEFIRSLSKNLILKVEEINQYKKDSSITIYREELTNLYYYSDLFYIASPSLLHIASKYDLDHALLYKSVTRHYEKDLYFSEHGYVDDNQHFYRKNLYTTQGDLKLDKYILLMKESLERYNYNLDILLKIGGYYE